MDKIIEKSKKFWLESGDYRFSPLMKATSTISLEYCNQISDVEHPLLFAFPQKSLASLWISVSLLVNFYFEEYIDNSTLKLKDKFKKGDKIKVFNTIAEVEKVELGKLTIAFKNNPGIKISNSNSRLFENISIVDVSRKIQTTARYNKEKNKVKKERNVISKILEPKNSVKINQENLNSKILLIAGNGNVKKIRDSLIEECIYNEELIKIFPEGKNLIIKKDLSSYIIDTNEYDKKVENFTENYKNLIVRIDSTSLKDSMKNLLNEDQLIIDEFFDYSFKEIIDEFGEDIPVLLRLSEIYPGLGDFITENLKAVVINDITQYNVYKNTIDYFLENNIPVIFVTNRNVEKSDEINYFDDLFDKYPEINRINWNKNKIESLKEFEKELSYLDDTLWAIAKRYSVQKIVIDARHKHSLDKLIPNLSRLIRDLEGFEDLKLSYFKYLNKVLFALKNSCATAGIIHELIGEFEISFDAVKDNGMDENLKELIENVISITKDFKVNTKSISLDDNMFSQVFFEKESTNYLIPLNSVVPYEFNDFESIVFPGYPYNEYSGKYLTDSVLKNYVSNIKLMCWEYEGEIAYKYLIRRLLASYFVEKISFETEFNRGLISSNEGVLSEVDSMITIKLNNEISIDCNEHIDETVDSDLYKFRYKNYHVTDSSLDFVNCNIINFIDDSFMFLTKTGKILAEVEDDNGNVSIREASFSDLSNGYRVFKYKRDRETYRKIVSHNKRLSENIDHLYQWKEYLLSLYYKYDKNIAVLQNFLLEIKENNGLKESNPTKQNIRRWIFDESTLKPAKHNVELFLLASAINSEEINIKLNQMEEAYSSVNGFIISLSSKMKKKISETDLAENINTFEIIEQGFPILVETKRIFSLEESNVPIEYSNTRQILYANS